MMFAMASCRRPAGMAGAARACYQMLDLGRIDIWCEVAWTNP